MLKAVPAANKYKAAPKLLASKMIPCKEESLRLDVNSVLLTALLFADVSDERVNSKTVLLDCPCGSQHVIVQSTSAIPVGAQLKIDVQLTCTQLGINTDDSNTFDYILIQTDGSYLRKQDATAGGAGVVLWGAHVNRPPTALAFLAIQLPQATDSMHAEALGLQFAASYLSSTLTMH